MIWCVGSSPCWLPSPQGGRSCRGKPVAEAMKTTGVTEQSSYGWKKTIEGLGIAELRRLRTLEQENKKLKQLVADLSLDRKMLRDVLP